MSSSIKKVFLITNELCVKYDFIKNELKVNYESIEIK
jgi:hypothetical protein